MESWNSETRDWAPGKNLWRWLTLPTNDLSFPRVLGGLRASISWILVCIGFTPVLSILNPSHSISCTENLHFVAFSEKPSLAIFLSVSSTTSLWYCTEPTVTISTSSRKQKLLFVTPRVLSGTRWACLSIRRIRSRICKYRSLCLLEYWNCSACWFSQIAGAGWRRSSGLT